MKWLKFQFICLRILTNANPLELTFLFFELRDRKSKFWIRFINFEREYDRAYGKHSEEKGGTGEGEL